MPKSEAELIEHTCPNCGARLIAGSIALGWGARPLFRAGEARGATIEVPLTAGLCPSCGLLSLWSVPSEALRATLRLYQSRTAGGPAGTPPTTNSAQA